MGSESSIGHRMPFTSDHWECPSCGASLKKPSWRQFNLHASIIEEGTRATCENCEGVVNQDAVYRGDYDLIPWDTRNGELVFQRLADKDQWQKDFLSRGIDIPVNPIPPSEMERMFHELIRDGQQCFPGKDKLAIVGLSADRLQVAIAISHDIDFYDAGELLLANASVSFDPDGMLITNDGDSTYAKKKWWRFWKK